MGTLFRKGICLPLVLLVLLGVGAGRSAEKTVPKKAGKKPHLAAAGWFARGEQVKAAPKVHGQATMATQKTVPKKMQTAIASQSPVPQKRSRRVAQVAPVVNNDEDEWTPTRPATLPDGRPVRAVHAVRQLKQNLNNRIPASVKPKPPAPASPITVTSKIEPLPLVAAVPLPAPPPVSLIQPAPSPVALIQPTPSPMPVVPIVPAPVVAQAPNPLTNPMPAFGEPKSRRSKRGRQKKITRINTPVSVAVVASSPMVPQPSVALPPNTVTLPEPKDPLSAEDSLLNDPFAGAAGMGASFGMEDAMQPKKRAKKKEIQAPEVPAVIVPELKVRSTDRIPTSLYEAVCSCSCTTSSVTVVHAVGVALYRDSECKMTIWEIRGMGLSACSELGGGVSCDRAYLKVGDECKGVDDDGIFSNCTLKVKPLESLAN